MKEIREAYRHIPYTPELWRQKQNLPPTEAQGLVVGCVTAGKKTIALVDTGDIHCLMLGAAGVGKTANFLYPNIEFACASGMSFLCTDTKGDVYRNFAGIGYFDSVYAADLPHRAVSVYMYLKNRANKDKSCFPAIGTIAADLSYSQRTVRRALADLEKAGFIKRTARWRERGGQSSNLYVLSDSS